jgi:putative ABC transport system substrate-binding protein
MNRRHCISILGVAVLAAHLPARAESPGRVYRVGFLGAGMDEERDRIWSEELSRFGFVKGRNLVIREKHSAAGLTNRLVENAHELLAFQPDLLVTDGTVRARLLQSLTRTIPIVFTSGDPIGAGLLKDLRRPGGNLTGVSSQECLLRQKRLELLRELVPKARRVVVLDDLRPDENPCAALAGSGLTPIVATRGNAQEGNDEATLHAILREKPDALLAESAFARKIFVALASKWRVPIVAGGDLDEGVLASLTTDFAELFRLVANQMGRVLRGTPPGDLPVQLTSRFRLEINGIVAKNLGIQIPASVLARATRVER